MLELGAGWGPWMCAAGVAAKKKGIQSIYLLGVEGSSMKIPFIKRHLFHNGLRPDTDNLMTNLSGINIEIYDGVITTDGKDKQFPLVEDFNYGGSLIENTIHRRNLPLITVKGYTLDELISKFELIDLIHFDIQGYEKEIIEHNINILNKVKFLAIGTHSREIEGFLTEFLYANGFKLIREKPCLVNWPDTAFHGCFIDITKSDGMQVWRNLNI
jgi:hypothetical protein